MYIPAHFKIKETAEIRTFVKAHPFGMLLSNGSQVPGVTHLPLQLMTDEEGNDSINIHLSKANPHANTLKDGESVVAVFLGTNGYISPRWYAAKDNVPTWNYTAVHAFGRLRKIEKEAELMKLVDQLTIEHEEGAESPWRADWSVEKIRKMLNAIIGFEMKVERWEGKKKIGQNRSAEDQASLKRNLEKSADPAYQFLAQQMK
ncbi:MAG: FMN-binding negative transcriptional regulator [Candidatus Marinimicrobia bacterium]|jgi:transcriptional regulator|nr:FMN-binding negative transcriptional regulator [Candidatus Neomarinimicrobiota bacterium]